MEFFRKRNNDKLFHFLNALSKKELSAVKLEIKRRKKIDSQKFLALIDYYQKKYVSTDEIAQKLKITKPHLTVLKSRLFDFISNFMVDYLFADKEKMNFYRTYILMSFFHSRKEYSLVEKVLDKEKSNLNLGQNPIRFLLANDLYASSLIGSEKALEVKETLDTLDEEIIENAYMLHMYYNVNIVKRRMYLRPVAESIIFKEYKTINDWERQYSIEIEAKRFPLAYQILLIIKAYYNETGIEGSYDFYVLEQYRLVSSHEGLMNKNSIQFLNLLVEYATAFIHKRDIKNVKRILHDIRNHSLANEDQNKFWPYTLSNVLFLEARIEALNKRRDLAISLIKKSIEQQRNFSQNILEGNKAKLNLKQAILLFEIEEYKICNQQLNLVINNKDLKELFDKSKGLNQLSTFKLFLFQYMIHFELNNHDLLQRIIRILKNESSNSSFETAIISNLRALEKDKITQSKLTTLINLYHDLSESEQKEKGFDYSIFMNWISKKITS